MPDRILDFSQSPVKLRSQFKQLVIRQENGPTVTIPFEDIAVVLISHPQITFSQSVLEELTQNGSVLVACNRKSLPVGMFVPLAAHHLTSRRLRLQATTPLPRLKKAWQQIVRAKISAQAQLLERFNKDDAGLLSLVSLVKSGDPQNVEARAAKRYWGKLFEGFKFQRKPEGDDPINVRLNFGYGVLRGIVARAICATGFHPSLGLHHHNKYNAYCLADDLMEPFRPLVDSVVRQQAADTGIADTLSPEVKKELIEPLLGRLCLGNELRTLFDAVTQLADSLVQFFSKESDELAFPARFEMQTELAFAKPREPATLLPRTLNFPKNQLEPNEHYPF